MEEQHPESQTAGNEEKLSKELGLWDVYCVSTGAMFSSGFFLLPGIATAQTGPSAVLAYLAASLLMVPSMLAIIELSTALPRAGGSYYFLDRSLGPGVGTVAGMGTWLALILKSAFALVGIGAYLAIIPAFAATFGGDEGASPWVIKGIAVAMTVFFVTINIVGAKQSALWQNIFVATILIILGAFLVQGFRHIFGTLGVAEVETQFTPFFHPEYGLAGFISTIGLVFVAYSGLTKVASVSEEVRKPERNLPLGIFLSLGTATFIYVCGVFVIIAVLDPDVLRGDLAPVATAAEKIAPGMPTALPVVLIVISALAAFASTGNAGIMSASRFPFAMSRDHLIPKRFGKLGRTGTPGFSILVTGAVTAFFIIVFSTEEVAKLGSAFNLLVFALINLAVVVMRESRIDGYDPSFRVPLYPWIPIAGSLISVWLIIEMGWLPLLLCAAIIVGSTVWYFRYGRSRVTRSGAIMHVFARLGKYRHPQLREEFREIIREKGLRESDPFDKVVLDAEFLEVEPDQDLDDILRKASDLLAPHIGMQPDSVYRRLTEKGPDQSISSKAGIALMHFRTQQTECSSLILIRSKDGICFPDLPATCSSPEEEPPEAIYGIFLLASPQSKPGQHLRFLAELADKAENETFVQSWRSLKNQSRLKEAILRDSRFLEIMIGGNEATSHLPGQKVAAIEIPPGAFLAMIRRNDELLEPTGDTILEEYDYVIFIGGPEPIEEISGRYIQESDEAKKDEK